MSICIYRSDCRKAVIVHYEGAWVWNEYLDANRVANEMAEECAHAVSIIHDFSEIGSLPPHFFAYLRLSDQMPLPDNLLRMMTVGTTEGTRLHLRMVRLASRGKVEVQQAPTLEDALKHLASRAA